MAQLPACPLVWQADACSTQAYISSAPGTTSVWMHSTHLHCFEHLQEDAQVHFQGRAGVWVLPFSPLRKRASIGAHHKIGVVLVAAVVHQLGHVGAVRKSLQQRYLCKDLRLCSRQASDS